jgi:glutaredoxin-like protein
VIPLRDQDVLRERFARELTGRLRVDYFTQRPSRVIIPGREECALCEDGHTLLKEIASLSARIALTVHDIEDEPGAATALGVNRIPGIVVRGVTNRPLRFSGVPSGNQFPGFIETLINAATGKADLRPETLRTLKKIRSDVSVQVFVAPASPYSPSLARTAFKAALMAPKVMVEVVDATEFPALVQRLGIRGVPTTVFDEGLAVRGAMDEATFAQALLRAVEGRPLTPPEFGSGPISMLPEPKAPNQPVRTASGLVLPR